MLIETKLLAEAKLHYHKLKNSDTEVTEHVLRSARLQYEIAVVSAIARTYRQSQDWNLVLAMLDGKEIAHYIALGAESRLPAYGKAS